MTYIHLDALRPPMHHWSLVQPSRIHWKRFDSEWVVYEEASNQTLILDEFEIDVLICLSSGSLEDRLLEKKVLDDLQLQVSDEVRLMVRTGMARLKSVGLINHMQDASISNQSR